MKPLKIYFTFLISCFFSLVHAQVLDEKSIEVTQNGELLEVSYSFTSKERVFYKVTPIYIIDRKQDTMRLVEGAVGHFISPGQNLKFTWEIEKELKYFDGRLEVGLIITPLVETSNLKRGEMNTFNLNIPDSSVIKSVKLINSKGIEPKFDNIKKQQNIQLLENNKIKFATGISFPTGNYQILIKTENKEIYSPFFRVNPKVSPFIKYVLPGMGVAALGYLIYSQLNPPLEELPGAPSVSN